MTLINNNTITNNKENEMRLENGIVLDNGSVLYTSYGKCQPNLTFIVGRGKGLGDNEFPSNDKERHFDGHAYFHIGGYRKNKKGTDVFDCTLDTHVFVIVNWGGSGSRTRGEVKVKAPDPVYYRWAPTNGRGAGATYYIFTVDDFNRIGCGLSEDDF